ncbi:MAG: chromate efflux transporter [Myxococcales bacterium]|nr:chromate efflux transporter [Myxococcales bacterium]
MTESRSGSQAAAAPSLSHEIPFDEALRVWARVAIQSFGGPAGQIAVMHRILVEEKRWVSEERFLHALSYCMLLPGPEAQQLATYLGWLLHRTRGGLAAGILFVVPGFVSILALSLLYTAYGDVALVEGFFYGVKPAVLALVLEALLRIGRRALGHRVQLVIAAAAFVSIFFLDLPFPWIVFGAGAIGVVGTRWLPEASGPPKPTVPSTAVPVVDALLDRQTLEHTRPSLARAVRVAVIGLAFWWVPIGLLVFARGADDVYAQISFFFSKLAVVTFGGAYAVLAYMAQQAVETYGWLAPGEMLDGLGMAETTPGPLIQVVQFVGFLGAYRSPGTLPAWIAGTLAAVLTTWVTFVPCFLWIFLGAPWIEQLRESRPLRGALSGITAAVVGVVLNLAIWFSLHTVFGVVEARRLGLLVLQVPDWATLDVAAAVIAVAAAIATLRFHVGMLPLIGSSALAGVLWRLIAQ